MSAALVSILFFLIVAVIVLWLVQTIVGNLGLPAPLPGVIIAITALILLIAFLGYGYGPGIHLR